MEKRIQDELNILKDIIVDTVPVEQIFLFGSYANGTPHADSDLDIYVVMPENADIREIDAMRLIHRVHIPIGSSTCSDKNRPQFPN